MQSPSVVVTDSDVPVGRAELDPLRAAGLDVRVAACHTAEEVIGAAEDASALLVQWAPITAEVLDRLQRLRFISRLGIGYDMIDVEAATKRGIAVANTPDYCVEEVATHTIALILALGRRLPQLDGALRAGRWSVIRDAPQAIRPSGTVLSVVGFGRIGSLVASFGQALGFRVLVHDPYVQEDAIRQAGFEHASIDRALSAADVLTLHAPLTAATRHMVDREAISRLKQGAQIVNTCRGGLIDEAALAEALRGGRLAGAALDVFETEPLPNESPLRSIQGVILTPHAAWYSPDSLAELPRKAAAQIADFFAGHPVPSIVNPSYVENLRTEETVQ